MTNYFITPEMGSEETAIYQKIFELDFYNKQARNTLKGAAGYSGGDWTSLREGDSSITRVNRNEVAKNYKSLATEARLEVEKMVQSYLKFRATPQQVVGDDTVAGSYYRGVASAYDGYRGDMESLL
jgi:hypothetical protein